MSTKSQTKNELARISAKIQQLKKKYPTSSELYIPTEKQNLITKLPIHDVSQEYNNHFESLNKKYDHQTSSKHQSRNSPHQNSNQNTDRSSKNQNNFVHTEFNPNGRFYQERKYHQSCNKKSLLNKENVFPFSQDLNCQKPFKEYKQELKNLKKQILSSLDFQNFQLSKQRTQNTPKIINNSFDTFSKKEPLNANINTVFANQSKLKKAEIQIKTEEQTNSQKPKVMIIRIDEESQNSMKTEENQINNSQAINRFETAKNYESHLSLEYLNEILQKLHEDFHQYKQETNLKMEKFESDTQKCSKQRVETNLRVQSLEREFKNKELSKPLEFDFKILEIQNQSIAKLSKQVHKEIQLINAEINDIKSQCFDLEKSSESESIEFSRDKIESLTFSLKEEMMKEMELNNQEHIKELGQMESKFFREIFDLKNEIELMREKIKKEEYFEKTLKTLIPQSARTNEVKVEDMAQNVRNLLLKDELFFTQLNLKFKSCLDQKILEQVSSKISSQVNQLQTQISDSISKELNCVNKTLKEFETKMVSYGILIENVEEGLKEISNSENDEQIESDLINKIKEAVIKEIDSELGSKMLCPLKESILKEKDSKGFSKEYHRKTSVQIESDNAEVQICPIVNQRNYVSNDASQVSIFTAQEVNSDIWLTSVDDHSSKKMFSSEVRVYEKPHSAEKNQPSFLLDELVKNSLVFSALNH